MCSPNAGNDSFHLMSEPEAIPNSFTFIAIQQRSDFHAAHCKIPLWRVAG